MKRDIPVASPPERPLLIFDGECNFCMFWIRRWQQCTGDRVTYAPSQDAEIRSKFPELPGAIFNESVQFIETDGQVYSGAEAVFRSLAYSPCKRWPLWLYEKIPGFAPAAEWFYKLVAGNRGFFSWLTRWLFSGQKRSK